MNSIEVILSPALFEYRTTKGDCTVVVVDVLRATTAFCAAFESGIKSIIPVSGLDKLLEFKKKGYLTAAERDGNKVDFADYGNSPTVFLKSDLSGKNLAYSTTNGTQAVEMAKQSTVITVAAFANLNAVSNWIISRQRNVIILCSGWKNTFSLEDTLCAGALAELLEQSGKFSHICDASEAALSLWKSSGYELNDVVRKANHYQRLVRLGQQDDLQHCFRLNTSKAVPVWDGKGFVNANASAVS
jgi:2-phosphosulfolactate phosphatase